VKIVKDASINFLNSLINSALGFLFTFLILRFSTHNTAALYFLTFSITYLLYLPSLGILAAIVSRYVAYYYGRKHVVGLKTMLFGSLILSFIISLSMGLLTYVALPFIEQFYPLFRGYELAISILISIIGPIGLIMALMNATHRFKDSFISQTILNITKLSIAAFLLYQTHRLDFNQIVFASAIGITLSYTYGISKVLNAFWPPKIDISSLGNLWSKIKYGISSITSSIRSFIFSWFDIIILGYIRSAEDVAGYNAVLTIIRNPMRIINSTMATTLLPHMSKRHGEDMLNSSFLNEALRLMAYISFISIAYITLLSDRIIYLLFPKYTAYHNISLLIGLSFIFIGLTTIIRNYVKAIRWAKPLFYSSMGALIINIILDILLIPTFGPMGAALATAISCIFEFTFIYIYVSKKESIDLRHLKYPIAVVIPFIIIGLLIRTVVAKTLYLFMIITLLLALPIILIAYIEKRWFNIVKEYVETVLKNYHIK